MINPFLRYPDGPRRKAIGMGIIADVARKTAIGKSVISRALSGETLQAKPNVVAALNSWLGRHAMPKAAAVLKDGSTLACLGMIALAAYVWCWA